MERCPVKPVYVSLILGWQDWQVGRRQHFAWWSPVWGEEESKNIPNMQRSAFGVLDLEILERVARSAHVVTARCASSSRGHAPEVDSQQGRLFVALLRIVGGRAVRSARIWMTKRLGRAVPKDEHVIPRRMDASTRLSSTRPVSRRFGSTRHRDYPMWQRCHGRNRRALW